MAEVVRVTILLWLLLPTCVIIMMAIDGIDRVPPGQQAARLIVLGGASLLLFAILASVLLEVLRLVRP